MAVLAMDQYAHAIADRLGNAAVVEDRSAIAAALDARRVPVLAPYRWLREADPLPHSWDVTSDSIAAWVAGAIGARRLVLIKPPQSLLRPAHQTRTADSGAVNAADDRLVDAYFARALPANVTRVIVSADQVDTLRA